MKKELKKIRFYNHPSEPHEEQVLFAFGWTVEQILDYHYAYKKWHREVHGPTEMERLTEGKKIVFRKITWM